MLLPFRKPEAADAGFDRAGHLEADEAPAEHLGNKKRRARRHRLDKIQRAVDQATEQWMEAQGIDPRAWPVEPDQPLLRPLPRPPGLGSGKSQVAALPPRRREEVFQASFARSVLRLFSWIRGALHFVFGVVWDQLCRRDTEFTRAERLRKAFEAMGTTFIKLGQQLSMRLDLLSYAYTRELENMLDRVPPMPFDEAILTIERATGKRLEELFEAFDPEPIGSASVACVYEAVLKTGERVAVKVRRPGIGVMLAADMRALGWLLKAAELLFLRPDFTVNFVYELRTMLMEELDLVREARFNELFRRRMKKTKQLNFASAPKVFYEHSCSEVLVAEFLTGVWLTEIMAALETQDTAALAKLDEMNIDPIILARRIQLVARFNNFENIFFHADLHPANILIQPGNKVILIDFGSCGSFSRKELNSWRRWFDAQSVDDVGGMVQAALSIIEPLPPIDKNQFAQRLEAMFWNDLYAIKSKHSEWWERISARMWLGFLKLSREFEIPMRLNTLRMIRASMLADTIAARLDNDQDPYEEYRHYERGAGKRAKNRTIKRVRQLLGPGKFVRIEQGVDSALKFGYQLQRTLDSLSSIGIIPLIGKAAEAIYVLLRTTFIVGALASAIAMIGLFTTYRDSSFLDVLLIVIANRGFQLVALVPVWFAFRRIFFRLTDRDYYPDRESGFNR